MKLSTRLVIAGLIVFNFVNIHTMNDAVVATIRSARNDLEALAGVSLIEVTYNIQTTKNKLIDIQCAIEKSERKLAQGLFDRCNGIPMHAKEAFLEKHKSVLCMQWPASKKIVQTIFSIFASLGNDFVYQGILAHLLNHSVNSVATGMLHESVAHRYHQSSYYTNHESQDHEDKDAHYQRSTVPIFRILLDQGASLSYVKHSTTTEVAGRYGGPFIIRRDRCHLIKNAIEATNPPLVALILEKSKGGVVNVPFFSISLPGYVYKKPVNPLMHALLVLQHREHSENARARSIEVMHVLLDHGERVTKKNDLSFLPRFLDTFDFFPPPQFSEELRIIDRVLAQGPNKDQLLKGQKIVYEKLKNFNNPGESHWEPVRCMVDNALHKKRVTLSRFLNDAIRESIITHDEGDEMVKNETAALVDPNLGNMITLYATGISTTGPSLKEDSDDSDDDHQNKRLKTAF